MCHFPGRRWAGRQVYDGHRCYLPKDHPWRKKSSAANDPYQFATDDDSPPALMRTYEEYDHNGKMGSERQPCDGVKGLWCLHILPYVHLIRNKVDKMHTDNNTVTDTLDSLRPTQSGNAFVYKHENRTIKETVLRGCEEEGIFYHLRNGDRSSILTAVECGLADARMNRVIGACKAEELPKGVMKKGKAGTSSHDTILWATTWARWCLKGLGSKLVMDNIFEIWDIMGQLNSSQLNIDKVKEEIYPALIRALVARQGLVPPSESTITLHELVHICDQVWDQGAPRVSTLYKFERINLFLKVLLKNTAAGKFHGIGFVYIFAGMCCFNAGNCCASYCWESLGITVLGFAGIC